MSEQEKLKRCQDIEVRLSELGKIEKNEMVFFDDEVYYHVKIEFFDYEDFAYQEKFIVNAYDEEEVEKLLTKSDAV